MVVVTKETVGTEHKKRENMVAHKNTFSGVHVYSILKVKDYSLMAFPLQMLKKEKQITDLNQALKEATSNSQVAHLN